MCVSTSRCPVVATCRSVRTSPCPDTSRTAVPRKNGRAHRSDHHRDREYTLSTINPGASRRFALSPGCCAARVTQHNGHGVICA